jgi:hypothetical protein
MSAMGRKQALSSDAAECDTGRRYYGAIIRSGGAHARAILSHANCG